MDKNWLSQASSPGLPMPAVCYMTVMWGQRWIHKSRKMLHLQCQQVEVAELVTLGCLATSAI